MKSFSSFVLEAKADSKLDIKQTNISIDDITDYLVIASKMLSSEAVKVINGVVSSENQFEALEDSKFKSEIDALKKADRIKELPWLLSEEEFKNVINSKKPLDFYVYDLVSEQGRNKLVKKFQPMLHKIAYKYANANGISADDTYSAGLEGFTRALNNYGKKRSEYVRTSSELDNIDLDGIAANESDTVKNIPFASYATAMVSNYILEYLKNEMNLVRRPASDQARERETTGNTSRQAVVSGDTPIGTDSAGNARSKWDSLATEIGSEGTDHDTEIEALWKQIFKLVEDKFGKETTELWYKKNGLNGRKVEKTASSPTEYYKLRNIVKFLTTDKEAKSLLNEIRELMADEDGE